MNQGKQFNDVRAVSYFSGSNAGVGFADVVLNENGRAILHETKKRNMLSRLGHKGIKTLNHKDDDVEKGDNASFINKFSNDSWMTV